MDDYEPEHFSYNHRAEVAMFEDRRTSPRRRTVRRVELVASGLRAAVTMANVSASGAFLTYGQPPAAGSKVHIIEKHRGDSVHMVAEIVRSIAPDSGQQPGCGVVWKSVKTGTSDAMRGFMRSLGISDSVDFELADDGRPHFSFTDSFTEDLLESKAFEPAVETAKVDSGFASIISEVAGVSPQQLASATVSNADKDREVEFGIKRPHAQTGTGKSGQEVKLRARRLSGSRTVPKPVGAGRSDSGKSVRLSDEPLKPRESMRISGEFKALSENVFSSNRPKKRFTNTGSYQALKQTASDSFRRAAGDTRSTHRIALSPTSTQPHAEDAATEENAIIAIAASTGDGAKLPRHRVTSSAMLKKLKPMTATAPPRQTPGRTPAVAQREISERYKPLPARRRSRAATKHITAAAPAQHVAEEVAAVPKEVAGTRRSSETSQRRRSRTSSRQIETATPAEAPAAARKQHQQEQVTVKIRDTKSDGKITLMTMKMVVIDMRCDAPRSIDDIEMEIYTDVGTVAIVARRRKAQPTLTGALVTCDIVRVDERGNLGIFKTYVDKWSEA